MPLCSSLPLHTHKHTQSGVRDVTWHMDTVSSIGMTHNTFCLFLSLCESSAEPKGACTNANVHLSSGYLCVYVLFMNVSVKVLILGMHDIYIGPICYQLDNWNFILLFIYPNQKWLQIKHSAPGHAHDVIHLCLSMRDVFRSVLKTASPLWKLFTFSESDCSIAICTFFFKLPISQVILESVIATMMNGENTRSLHPALEREKRPKRVSVGGSGPRPGSRCSLSPVFPPACLWRASNHRLLSAACSQYVATKSSTCPSTSLAAWSPTLGDTVATDHATGVPHSARDATGAFQHLY